MALHSDDVNNPLNLSDQDYWAEYERFRAAHPDAVQPIPPDQFQVYDDIPADQFQTYDDGESG